VAFLCSDKSSVNLLKQVLLHYTALISDTLHSTVITWQ
jgi:hypothetical protein